MSVILKRQLELLPVLAFVVAGIDLLIGNGLLNRLPFLFDFKIVQTTNLPNEQISVVVGRRNNGSFRTLGHVGRQVEAIGHPVYRWSLQGHSKLLAEAWGISPSKYETRSGGIYYYPGFEGKAEVIQKLLTSKNASLAKTIPLIEVQAQGADVFIDTHAVAGDSILIYLPD